MTRKSLLILGHFILLLQRYDSIPSDRIEFCRGPAEAGEWLLSIEMGLDNLYEFDAPLRSEEVAAVRQLTMDIFPEGAQCEHLSALLLLVVGTS